MNNLIQPKLLRDIITLDKGKPPAQQNYYGPDADLYLTPDYLRGGALPEQVKPSSNAIHVENGDTIVLWDGSNAGEIFRGKKGVLASTMAKVSHDENYDSNYFFYALKGREAHLKGQTSGSGIPHVDKEVLGKLALFDFPKPEQSKIAEILSKLDQGIDQTEALIAKQQRIKTGLMHNLLTRGIDEHGNLRSEETHEFKDSPLGRIPVGWKVQGVIKLCVEIFLGLTTKVDYVEDGGVPLVRAKDINTGKLLFDETLQISKRQHRSLTVYRMAKKGDILVSKSGTLGICSLVDSDIEFSIYESIIVMQPNLTYCHSKYLLWLMREEATQNRLLKETVGSTVGHLNLLDFRKLVVQVPPIAEQKLIAKIFDKFHELLENNYLRLNKLHSLKTALMQDLLTGNVRVTPLLKNMEKGI